MVAFVVGIGSYNSQRTLKNPVSDATAIKFCLQTQNVDVFDAFDCDINELREQFDSFVAALRPGDAAFLYFAGRGIVVNDSVRLVARSNAAKPDIETDALHLDVLIARSATQYCD